MELLAQLEPRYVFPSIKYFNETMLPQSLPREIILSHGFGSLKTELYSALNINIFKKSQENLIKINYIKNFPRDVYLKHVQLSIIYLTFSKRHF